MPLPCQSTDGKHCGATDKAQIRTVYLLFNLDGSRRLKARLLADVVRSSVMIIQERAEA
jgi:hypothetical protein